MEDDKRGVGVAKMTPDARTAYLQMVVQVRDLWNEGLSTSEIGERLGITKNVVIGMAHRYPGFNKRENPVRHVRGRERTKVLEVADAQPTLGYRAIAEQAGVKTYTALTVLRKERPGRVPAVVPRAGRATLDYVEERARPKPIELIPKQPHIRIEPPKPGEPREVAVAPTHAFSHRHHRGCSWPIGEPGTSGFRYCDAPRVKVSYCAEHAALAFVKPIPKADRRGDAA